MIKEDFNKKKNSKENIKKTIESLIPKTIKTDNFKTDKKEVSGIILKYEGKGIIFTDKIPFGFMKHGLVSINVGTSKLSKY